MKKRLAVIFVIFGLFVALDYAFTLLQMTFRGAILGSIVHADTPVGTGGGLTSINFSFFEKGGKGWSDITQGYGRTPYSSIYPDDWHDGIDIGAVYGAPIYSPNVGTVFATGNMDDYCYHKGFGMYVAVKDPAHNLILWYAHLGTIDVSPGQTIASGTLLGTIGETGLETGPNLHFSIFDADGFTMTPRDGCGPEPTGQDVNPLLYVGTLYK